MTQAGRHGLCLIVELTDAMPALWFRDPIVAFEMRLRLGKRNNGSQTTDRPIESRAMEER